MLMSYLIRFHQPSISVFHQVVIVHDFCNLVELLGRAKIFIHFIIVKITIIIFDYIVVSSSELTICNLL